MNELSAGLRTHYTRRNSYHHTARMKRPHGLLLALIMIISGCAVAPPTQEMSEARQSVEAARTQGADKLAPVAMDNADKLLSDAEDKMRQGDYTNAQRDAVAAREAAQQARAISEQRQAQQQTHQSPPPSVQPAPAEITTPEAPTPPAQASEPETYTVLSGDSLWRIAARADIYGDPHLWPLLLKTNAHALTDADLIFPGQTLRIGRHHARLDKQHATQHARQRGAWTLGGAESTDDAYLRHHGQR